MSRLFQVIIYLITKRIRQLVILNTNAPPLSDITNIQVLLLV